jgi:hypothetical protein
VSRIELTPFEECRVDAAKRLLKDIEALEGGNREQAYLLLGKSEVVLAGLIDLIGGCAP